MAAPTAASKFNAPPCFSASCASRTPCLASNALLAVTTDLPDASAASTARLAGSPAPPISSTNTSMSRERASSAGSLNHFTRRRSMPRSLPRERAQTATISTRRPQRKLSVSRCCVIWAASAAPTLPKPATPTLRGAAMTRTRRSACRRERNDVVQLLGGGFEEAADIARGLADALLILHQRDAHMAFAIFAEADAGRHRDLGFLDQQLGKFHATEGLERIGQRRPGKHRGTRRRHMPAGAAEAFHQ